ncbi:hypothetical protein EYF80_061079 [Liparis tanakae]|uniref:Uncharacterized protein n=1 Tax=Liparis tanakae TaxID=230148 RepID=A0A4Z2EIW9_9TELE|nr:hypothetical protein EYF80_061079 [Liparis tanakae]
MSRVWFSSSAGVLTRKSQFWNRLNGRFAATRGGGAFAAPPGPSASLAPLLQEWIIFGFGVLLLTLLSCAGTASSSSACCVSGIVSWSVSISTSCWISSGAFSCSSAGLAAALLLLFEFFPCIRVKWIFRDLGHLAEKPQTAQMFSPPPGAASGRGLSATPSSVSLGPAVPQGEAVFVSSISTSPGCTVTAAS